MSGSIPSSDCSPQGAHGYSYGAANRSSNVGPGALARRPANMDFELSYSPSQGRVFHASTEAAERRSRRRQKCPAPSSLNGDPFNLEVHMIKNRQKAWERLCLEEAQKHAMESEGEDVAGALMPESPAPRPRRPGIGERLTGLRGRPFGTSAEPDRRFGRPFDPDCVFEHNLRYCSPGSTAGRRFDIDRDLTYRRLNLPTPKASQTRAACPAAISVQPASPPHSSVQRLPRICPRPEQNICPDSSPRSSSPTAAPCRPPPISKMEPAAQNTRKPPPCRHGHELPSCHACPTCPSAPCPPRTTTEGIRTKPPGTTHEIHSSRRRPCRPRSPPPPPPQTCPTEQPLRIKREPQSYRDSPAGSSYLCPRPPTTPVCTSTPQEAPVCPTMPQQPPVCPTTSQQPPVCPPQQNRQIQTTPRSRPNPNYRDNSAGPSCPNPSPQQQNPVCPISPQQSHQGTPTRSPSGSDHQFTPPTPLQPSTYQPPLRSGSIPIYGPNAAECQTPQQQTPPPYQDNYAPVSQVPCSNASSRSNSLGRGESPASQFDDSLNYELPNMGRDSYQTSTRGSYESSGRSQSPTGATYNSSGAPQSLATVSYNTSGTTQSSAAVSYNVSGPLQSPARVSCNAPGTPQTPARFSYSSSGTPQSPHPSTPLTSTMQSPGFSTAPSMESTYSPRQWSIMSTPQTPNEPPPHVSPDVCTPPNYASVNRSRSDSSGNRSGQEHMEDLYDRATYAFPGFRAAASAGYSPVSSRDSSGPRYIPSPQNESTFYYNPSMFDEPSEFNRTGPCPTPAYADMNATCVDLTDESRYMDRSIQEVPHMEQQQPCSPSPQERTCVDDLRAALLCPAPTAAQPCPQPSAQPCPQPSPQPCPQPCPQPEAASGVCPMPQAQPQQAQLQPQQQSPQQPSTSGLGPTSDQPSASLFRCLARRLSTTYDLISGLVSSPKPPDEPCPGPTQDESCNTTTFDLNTLFASPHCPQPSTDGDQSSFGLRNMFNTSCTTAQQPAERICDMNRSDDTSIGFSMRNLFAEPLNVPSSVKECANAKRCGRVQFDSSDKDNVADAQRKQIRQAQMETLVQDTYCPGIIQETIDGRENFNRESFKIAINKDEHEAAKSGPPKEDPMTLLEAFAIRIDRERTEVRKDMPDNATQERIAEIVGNYFATHNPTDLNRCIKSLLLSECLQEQEEKEKAKGLSIDAEVQKLVTNFPSNEKIKLILYTGRTWPIETENP